MKTKVLFTVCASVLAAVACQRMGETYDTQGGKGKLSLNLSSTPDFTSKAVNESIYRNTDYYDVVITSSTGKEVLKCKGIELGINTPKELDMGTYKIVASYGTEAAASREEFYSEGSASVVLQPREERTVDITCTPTCGKVFANFDAEMSTYYSSFYVEYGGTQALGANTVKFNGGETDPWYIKLNPEGETVTYKICLTAKEAYQITDAQGNVQKNATVTGSFKLMRNKAHKLTIKPNYTPQTDGGMKLTITINEETEERNVNIEVPVSWI